MFSSLVVKKLESATATAETLLVLECNTVSD